MGEGSPPGAGQTGPEVGGHRDELLSLLAQSSWLLVSPLAVIPQVRLFFLRCDMASVSEPDSACREQRVQTL